MSVPSEPRRSPLAFVVGSLALGTGMQVLCYALGYAGRGSPIWLFLLGLAVCYLPAARALLAISTTAADRRRIVILLGLALAAGSILSAPLYPTGFDELLHETTLWQLPYFGHLFTTNTVLPVSPYYPGLELVTLGVKFVTGLSSVAAGDVTIALSRLVLVIVLYLFTARATRSERAGGIAVLVYVASPQFYAFNAAFSYQTLALSFAAITVYLTFLAIDRPQPSFDRLAWSALVTNACLVLTHHLVSWITVGFLVLWTLVNVGRHREPGRLRVLGTISAGALVTCAAWTAVASHEIVPYLRPIITGAWSGLIGIISTHGSRRQLFKGVGGQSTPKLEELLIVLSVLAFLVVLVPSTYAVWRRKVLRGGRQRWIVLALVVAYPLDLACALSSASAEVGQRASTFIFLGIALVIASWLAARHSRRLVRGGALIATVCFLGSVILGSGPIWTAVPGAYAPGADARSLDGPSVAAAQWAAANLPVDATVASDSEDSALLSAIGHLRPATALSGGENVAPIFYSDTLTSFDLSIIRTDRVAYLLVDDRLADRPPATGPDFEPNGTDDANAPSRSDLAKFADNALFKRVYDNGPIQIYDLSAILHTASAKARPVTGLAAPGGDRAVLSAFLLLGFAAVILRRRRPIDLEGALYLSVVALGALMALGLVAVYARLSAGPLSFVVLGLAAVAAVGLRSNGRHASPDALVPAPASGWFARGFAVLAIGALLAATTADLIAESNTWTAAQTKASLRTSSGARLTSAVTQAPRDATGTAATASRVGFCSSARAGSRDSRTCWISWQISDSGVET